MQTQNTDIAAQLAAANWEQLWPRLLLFSQRRTARLFWRGEFGGAMPGGVEPEDVVMKAIELALSGERRWNGNTGLYSFLCGVINSVLNHAAESLENRVTRRVDFSVEDYFPAPSARFLEPTVDREQEVVNRFIDGLRDDPLVHKIALHTLSPEVNKPAQLARKLHTSVRDIYNANKRLKRKLSEWQELLEDYG